MTKKACKYLLFSIAYFLVYNTYGQNHAVDSIGVDSLHIQNDTNSARFLNQQYENWEKTQNQAALVKAKSQDTVKVRLHSPKKASWMSAALPGLGQAYNKKYWKIPIIYVGFGVIAFLGYNYYTKFTRYKDTYMFRAGEDSTKTDYYPYITSKDVLYQNWSYNRRNFELTCIFGSLLYVLNIIDASVDAHLYKFDISNDLSLRIEPVITNYNYTSYNNPSTGIKLTLGF